jgi:hypothetical protein
VRLQLAWNFWQQAEEVVLEEGTQAEQLCDVVEVGVQEEATFQRLCR